MLRVLEHWRISSMFIDVLLKFGDQPKSSRSLLDLGNYIKQLTGLLVRPLDQLRIALGK